jgi:cytochrome P450
VDPLSGQRIRALGGNDVSTTETRPVLEFDHHSRHASRSRPELLARVRDHPVFWSESHGGYWVVCSHATVKEVLGDPETFSSAKAEDGTGGDTIPSVGPRLLPAECDNPRHKELRDLLWAKFNRKAVAELRPMVQSIVTSAIDNVVAIGEFDVIHDIADVIPAGVMTTYLGFPESDRIPFIRTVQTVLSLQAALMPGALETMDQEQLQAGMNAFVSARQTIIDLMAERRERPAGDLVSALVHQTDTPIDDDELAFMIFTLMVGGFENPSALIANSMLHLSLDAGLRAALIADPQKIHAATEEFLRFTSAAVSLARTCTRDVEFHGVQMRQGDRVLTWLPGANHDPAVFDQPGRYELGRANVRQNVGFGYGIHRCVGFVLAELEFDLLWAELLARMPGFTIDIERAERVEDAHTMYGFTTMPARTNR